MVPLPPLRPDSYFGERAPGLPLAPAVGVVLCVTLLTTAAIGGFGFVLAERVDATRTVENPDRPPEWVCDDRSTGDEGTATATTPEPDPAPDPLADRCDEPETVTVDVGDRLWDAFTGFLPFVLVAVPAGWLVLGGLLHALSWFAGGEGPFRDTLVVAAWALVPTLVRAAVALGALVVITRDVTFVTTEQFVSDLEATASSLRPLTLAIGAVVGLWEAYVYYHGLRHARSLSRGGALFVAGTAALVTFVLGLT